MNEYSPNKINMQMSYDEMKRRTMITVIPAGINEDITAKAPHKMMEDIAVVYRLDMQDVFGTGATALVTNDMLSSYGVTTQEFIKDAEENAPKTHPMHMETLSKSVGIFNDDHEGPDFMVCTTYENLGAGVIAYPDFMEKAAEVESGNFFVIPSSIHEVILIPDSLAGSVENMTQMVREVNEAEVAPEERLSDNVYHYDSKDKVFELADKYENRMQQKEAQKTATNERPSGKKSLLADIETKKEAAAKQPISKPKTKEKTACLE